MERGPQALAAASDSHRGMARIGRCRGKNPAFPYLTRCAGDELEILDNG
ncbi:MAG: hypothetical protein M1472_03370 [Planctomycetes bacterium]|nr:hypothetical protein [Planctomycetota bacterium]